MLINVYIYDYAEVYTEEIVDEQLVDFRAELMFTESFQIRTHFVYIVKILEIKLIKIVVLDYIKFNRLL